jgi:hypothetical protein
MPASMGSSHRYYGSSHLRHSGVTNVGYPEILAQMRTSKEFGHRCYGGPRLRHAGATIGQHLVDRIVMLTLLASSHDYQGDP